LALFTELQSKPKRTVLDFAPSETIDQHRFLLVFDYTIKHFREDISLEEVAEIAILSPTSFCRYFKQTTGKTLFQVILEYRLESAAQLLHISPKRINEIAFESGFEDMPYFNRSFKKWKGISPKQFRLKANREQ